MLKFLLHVQEPVFWNLHVFVNVSPGVRTVPSGIVTSLRKSELAQPEYVGYHQYQLVGVAVGEINVGVGLAGTVGVGVGVVVAVAEPDCAVSVEATAV